MYKCIYCDKPLNMLNFTNLFIEEDKLCIDCRNMMKKDIKYVDIGGIKVETFYDYDSLFKSLLIQYKECMDEALADIFLYTLKDHIRFKYLGYKIMFIPSSKAKLLKRGFNHLELIFADVKLDKINGLKMKQELIQEGKNIHQRQMMIDNYIYDGPKLDKVLIVDDVLTTGSSILGAINALKPYAKSIKALCIARKENAFICKNKCV